MAVSMNPQNNVFDTMRSARPRINNSPSFASTTTNEVKPQPEKDEVVQKSARNIEGVKTLQVGTINVYDLLKHKNLVVTEDTVKKLEEVYA